MPLFAGTRLGAYEILASLGAGGMGEVYRALDTKLEREVAIKILPDEVASDPERRARFEREARVLAALNHPNIAQIYGIEERALVMELVEGETLASHIKQGPLPVETALDYARQIADALEAAHEKGIIHRDLKPANIMVTPAGVVKVLDFGLARAADSSTASGDPAKSPTLTISPTRAGMIMGTAAYMSPEQARGKTVDRRADIWAFGAVLYEMLTGRQTFTGETITDVLASVVKEQPPLDRLPTRVRVIVGRCLQKDPRQRWQAIGDVRFEIEALLADPGGVSDVSRTAPRPLWKRAIPVLVAAILSAAIGGVIALNFKPSAPPSVSRFTVVLDEGQIFTNSGRPVVAISPDGTQMVYVANRRLYLRPMGQLEAKAIPGSDEPRGVTSPVFSPDGRSIAFFDNAELVLKRIAVTGGAAVTICQARNPWGMSWDSTGIIYGEGSQGILRVSPNGGNPEVLATVKNGEVAAHPQMLPGAGRNVHTHDGRKRLGPGADCRANAKIGRAQNCDSRRKRRQVSADRASRVFLWRHAARRAVRSAAAGGYQRRRSDPRRRDARRLHRCCAVRLLKHWIADLRSRPGVGKVLSEYSCDRGPERRHRIAQVSAGRIHLPARFTRRQAGGL
jgi:serine/threonine protein kinase